MGILLGSSVGESVGITLGALESDNVGSYKQRHL